MAKEIYISLTLTEASWIMGGLSEKYTKVLNAGGNNDNALAEIKAPMQQILQCFYEMKQKIHKPMHPLNKYVKQINFKPIMID